MKTVVLLLALITTAHCLSQIPDYFANNPTWYVAHEGGVPEINFYSGKKLIFPDGDSTIGNHTYRKLYQTGYFATGATFPPSPSPADYFNHVPYGLHRQEGRKFYFFNPSTQSDTLLISYEGQVGDYVESMYMGSFQIQSIDSLLIGSEYRRQLFVDTTNGDFLLEGIGYFTAQSDMFSAIYDEFPSFGVEALVHICYGQNNQALYPALNGGGGSCYTEHLGLNTSLIAQNEILYDPIQQVLTTSLPENSVEWSVFNLSGQRMLHSYSAETNVAQLPAGCYFATVKTEAGIVSQRFFKPH